MDTKKQQDMAEEKRNRYCKTFFPLMFGFCFLYVFMRIDISVLALSNWQNLLVNLFWDIYNILVCYGIAHFLPLKSEKLTAFLSFALFTVFNAMIDISFEFEFNSKSTILLVLSFASYLFAMLFFFFHIDILRYIRALEDESRRHKLLCLFCVLVIFCLLFLIVGCVILTILQFRNHEFRLTNFVWE